MKIFKKNNTSYNQSSENVVSIVHQVPAALFGAIIYTFFRGIVSPIVNEYHIFPRILKVDNPDLYANDLVFGTPEPLYTYLIYYYRLLNHLIPLPWISIISQFLSYSLLFFALIRLTSTLNGKKNPVVAAVAILLVGPTQIIGGHHLTYITFYPQYAAYAATLLSFSFIIERRPVAAAICVAFALFSYPLVGLHALILVCGLLIVFPSTRTKLPSTIIILVLAAIISLLPSLLTYSSPDISNMITEKYIGLIVYIRAKHHFCLSCMRDKPELKLAMVILFTTIFHLNWGRLNETKYKITSLLIICLFFGAIVSYVNNEIFMNFLLFQVNLAKSSPIILGLLFCYALVFLNARTQKGLFISSAFILSAGHLLALLVISLGDLLWSRISPHLAASLQKRNYLSKAVIKNILSNRAYDFMITLVSIISVSIYFHLTNDERFMQQMLVFGLAISILFFISRINSIKLIHVAAIVLTILAVKGFALGYLPASVKILRPQQEWADMCFFISKNISEDAVVVIPPNDKQFQYRSKRAAFVAFSHFSRIPEYGLEWMERMKMVKALPKNCCENTLRRPIPISFNSYYNMTEQDFITIRGKYNSVKYCIVSRRITLNFPLVYENRRYRLYDID